jgi:23S rRNA (cytidine1920-2'-O)/16S rRNA (cytidine1409-2'-O)-methyltransferase
MAGKKRIDVYLFENGLAESREKAKALIIAGDVFVDGQRCDKPSSQLSEWQSVSLKKAQDFVSRGGKKLEKAITFFHIDLSGKIAVDIGASTGGFTDCMLKHGAEYVYAVDVGYGQLAWSLRQDSRVCVMEHINARYLKRDMFDKDAAFASIDVSFISLKLILPALINVLAVPYGIVALVKPQFEAGKENVGKKGVVRDKNVHKDVIKGILKFAHEIGLTVCGLTYSPIKGPEGNIEYLAYFKSGGCVVLKPEALWDEDVNTVVEEAHTGID